MRKVRREVVKTINEFRAGFGRPQIYLDPLTNKAANEYANFLLQERLYDNPDEGVLEEVCQQFKIIQKQKAIVGYSHLDEDNMSGDPTKMAEFMDAHGLLLEMQEEMKQLSNADATHIGVGFAEDATKVVVVELLSQRGVMVNSLQPGEDGSVFVSGLVLDPKNLGLYAARVVSSTNDKKECGLVGPANITLDKATHQFTIAFPPMQEEVFYASDPKILELYVRRAKIDQIPYGQASTEKIKVQHLEQVLRLPMEYIPDPRVVKEDAHDQEQFERDMKERAERAEEERLIKAAQQAAKQEEKAKKREAMLAEREKKGGDDDEDGSGDDISGSEKSGSKSGVSGNKSSHKKSKSGGESLGQSGSRNKSNLDSDDDGSNPDDQEEEEQESDEGFNDLPNQTDMKRELIQAIEDERREYQELKKINEDCQKKIILMDSSNNRDYEKQSDQMLHEHKYLNTLANVH